MKQELRAKTKSPGLRRFINSFKYSLAGLKYAYIHEQSMTIHMTVTTLVIMAGFYFQITYVEWLLCLLMIGIILATELLNTSIEAVVDLVSPEQHYLAKIAKDTASAAVFIYSLVAFVVGLTVFLPYVVEYIKNL